MNDQRAPNVCIACRRRKRACDKKLPQCSFCIRSCSILFIRSDVFLPLRDELLTFFESPAATTFHAPTKSHKSQNIQTAFQILWALISALPPARISRGVFQRMLVNSCRDLLRTQSLWRYGISAGCISGFRFWRRRNSVEISRRLTAGRRAISHVWFYACAC